VRLVQRLFALGSVAVLALLAAACGTAPVPSDEVRAAADAAKEAGSARIETVWSVSYGSPPRTHEVRWTERVDYRRNRSTAVEHGTGCRTITVGDRAYSELPPGDALPSGKRWVAWDDGADEVDAEALFEQARDERTTTEDGGVIIWSTSVGVAVPDSGPRDSLDELREHTSVMEHLGDEVVHGVATTRYRAEIDRERLIRESLDAAGWKAENVERYLDELEESKEQVDVWIDADGLVRRTVTTETPLEWEEGSAGGWTTTTEYFDFGLEVEVEVPPADEVIGSEEWQRISDERMQAELDDFAAAPDLDVRVPGAFEPAVAPSCLD
jgi:uncharacterized membrane protein